ncbi:MAG: CDP-alcohol phosphatidyltransferase family protein [Paraprevotella sp.]|nr:CDP-alcohol phosphatidyltransferase family protein [Paraprevotella sp.]
MAYFITRQIPNSITCCNLISGCIAAGAAFHGYYGKAFLFIIIGAVFDFFDGMSARLLKVSSPIGKELDSLADVVTFGVAPSAMIFYLFHEVSYPAFIAPLRYVMPYTAFLMAAFSALRLAKFNLDTRQTSSFIGVPTPANTLFWASLIVGNHSFLVSPHFNALYLFLCLLACSILLVAEIPLFALKFKNLSWLENKIKFIFILACIPMIIFLGLSCFAAIIAWYVVLSLLTWSRKGR